MKILFYTQPRDWSPSPMRDVPPHWGLRPLLFKNSVCVFFNVPQNLFVQEVWDGAYGLSSSSKEAWKSYRLAPFTDVFTKAAFSPQLF